jgi:excinuclease ABC subunit B
MTDPSHPFELKSSYQPTGDQPQAIAQLVEGLKANKRWQVLQGATGTGKTFTMANIIQAAQRTTLVLVHNKTLAAQLYGEFKELFPYNRVEYFISNFDFYQPEAYLPKTDTYIDKEVVMNDEIEMMRASAVNSLLGTEGYHRGLLGGFHLWFERSERIPGSRLYAPCRGTL